MKDSEINLFIRDEFTENSFESMGPYEFSIVAYCLNDYKRLREDAKVSPFSKAMHVASEKTLRAECEALKGKLLEYEMQAPADDMREHRRWELFVGLIGVGHSIVRSMELTNEGIETYYGKGGGDELVDTRV